MQIIQQHNGFRENVWDSVHESLSNETILIENGESWSCTKLIPVPIGWEMWIHAIHTGTAAKFFVALANDNTRLATAIVLEASRWEIRSIIETSAGLIATLFPDLAFRERRTILMDIGKATYKVMNELDQKVVRDLQTEDLYGSLVIDHYQPLLDVEWIEDRMEGVGA
ncbi:hypothetical protein ACFPOG_12295 [Paenibacillus aestuarii]|uniref:Uncharacterized protein n=1 Tax=Paenibacillus aestuarii TaxID=516965 RepID=A0ABW0K7S8_9BACL